MAVVNSVSGPLDTADLGFTLMHEHIVLQSPGVRENFPVWDRAAELKKAVGMMREAMDRGVRTLVDLTVGHWRDLPFVKDVVAQTGMQVIVATGVYWEVPPYFRAMSGRTIDYIANLFARDVTEGIMDTGVRAGVIKCATDEPGVTADVERILRATARAHRKTGVPISTHTHAASRGGLAQQGIFESEGVDLSRVIIGHSGDSDDIEYLRHLIDRGSYIGMDRFGMDLFLATDRRVATVARLCDMGYAEKMVLSHDAACYFDWADETLLKQTLPNWHYNHIPDDVIPALREAGVSDEQIRTMIVDNPRRVFERQGAYDAMTRARRELGAFGERVAAAHLEAKGYRIRDRNFRTREGEIDIIADNASTLVFVEVRTRRGDTLGSPAESVTASKAAHILAAAQAYIQASDDCPAEQRIDVIAVSLAHEGRVLALEHIEGAVDDPGPG